MWSVVLFFFRYIYVINDPVKHAVASAAASAADDDIDDDIDDDSVECLMEFDTTTDNETAIIIISCRPLLGTRQRDCAPCL